MTAILLAMTLTVANGSYISVAKAPPATIITYAGSACPTGTIAADGSSLLRAGTYAALFAAIGTTYGSVDGTHFTVPDGRGVFIRGAGSQTISAITYTGTRGTTQNDATKKNGLALTDPGHTHTSQMADNSSDPRLYMSGGSAGNDTTFGTTGASNSSTTGITLGTGDSETRPANIAALHCIYF